MRFPLLISNAVTVFCVIETVNSMGQVGSAEQQRLRGSIPDLDKDDDYRIKVTHGQEDINSTLTRNGHYGEITISVVAFGQFFELDLKLNTHLFAVGYVERSVSRDGIVYHDVNQTESHCYYLGKVRNHSQSAAAVSTCNGIVGYFAVGNVSYHIHPQSIRLHGPHKVYRSRNNTKTVYKCGTDELSLGMLLNTVKHKKRFRRTFIWPQDLDKRNKIVELYIANDNSQFVSARSDFKEVTQRAKVIANTASITYQLMGIYLVLVGMDTWNVSDMISVNPTNAPETLNQWSSYRMKNINPSHYNDIGVLITNRTFNNGTLVGLAQKGRMCSNQYSAALIADVFLLTTVASTLMAHEIGHSFNLIHDNEYVGPCPCSDPSGRCIMYQSTSPENPPNAWSQCSKDQLATSFQHGLDICLYNIPRTIFEPATNCGNGIVEDGEQCDCGESTSQECNKACCSSECQLIAPATCAYGRCCNVNTCQVLSCGSECRAKAGACDLAEFCNGVDGLCPTDTHRPDGTNCTENETAAYCYDGLCRSRESQCQLIWGPGTLVSVDGCYGQNTYGAPYGNCGFNWLPDVTYNRCSPSDVLCGRLQCQGDSDTKLYYYTVPYGQMARKLIDDSCLTVIFDFGLATPDPGLVPNGASCGTGMMCVNQRCVNVTSVGKRLCPTNCKQNEVCNNVGRCQSIAGICTQPSGIPGDANSVQRVTWHVIMGTALGTAGVILVDNCGGHCLSLVLSASLLLLGSQMEIVKFLLPSS